MRFPNKILSFRTDKDESQEDLANAAGITQQMISLYEIGSSAPNVVVAKVIADHYGTTIEILYEESIKAYLVELDEKKRKSTLG